MRKWLFISSLSVLCLVGGLLAFTSRQFPRWNDLFALKPTEPVLYTLKKANFTVEVPAFGELQTASATPISVPMVRSGGLKIFWIIKDGSLVRKGDTLVEFDASELIQQLQETENNLEATLRQLEATVLRGSSDTGQVQVDREIAGMELEKAQTQAPKDQDIFTRNEIIEGELNIGLSTTKVKEWTGKVETKKNINTTSERILVIERKHHEGKRGMLQQTLSSLKILSPHDGLVMHAKDWMGQGTNIGDTRWPGWTILTIPDISSIKARVNVLESDAGSLKVGQSTTVVVDSHPNVRFNATVERIETLARPLDRESPVKYFEVLLKVQGQGGEILKPGKLVRTDIRTAHFPDALVVPRGALTEEARKFYVWVQRPNAPEKREVEIGSGDSARVVVRSGVREGESVLLNPPKSADASRDKDTDKNSPPSTPDNRGAPR